MARLIRLARVITLLAAGLTSLARATPSFATPEFERTWARTDKPVADGLVDRTWMWGPEPLGDGFSEPYADALGGVRTVQYFDNTGMEDNTFRALPPWDVTNGLLVTELMTGMQQDGDADFSYVGPAAVHIAGDPGDPDAPTYGSFAKVMGAVPRSRSVRSDRGDQGRSVVNEGIRACPGKELSVCFVPVQALPARNRRVSQGRFPSGNISDRTPWIPLT